MSEMRARPFALRDFPDAIAVGTGAVVAGALLASLLRPGFGRYLTEAIALVCAFAVAGMAAFAAISPTDLGLTRILRRPITVLALVAFGAALVTMPFAVMAVSGDGLRGLGDSLARSAALRGGAYSTVFARAFGLVLIVGGLRVRGLARSRALLLFGAALVAGSFLLTGHVRSHGPTIAVVLNALAHVEAAAFWFGGLLALGWSLRHAADDAIASGRLLALFARCMAVVLALLIAAGVGFAVLYLDSPGALVHTVYGQVLLVKLALVVTVLVISSANHDRLVPAAKTGKMAAVRVLRANIAAEQALLAAILVVTEVLMRQNPAG